MRAEAFNSKLETHTGRTLGPNLTIFDRHRLSTDAGFFGISITSVGFSRPRRRTSKPCLLRVAAPYLNRRRERGRFNPQPKVGPSVPPASLPASWHRAYASSPRWHATSFRPRVLCVSSDSTGEFRFRA
ncbi:hypothetical protein C8Q73DRAFT_176134 [Cubamyces lactineus]|nr:hypothetical protein C8Q73DRAFT_176134 [Cubamyces lactineus]